MSEQLPCRSAEVKIFSVFLCQKCREIWREIWVKFSVLRFPGFRCAAENFTKISRQKRREKRKISRKFHSAGAQRWENVENIFETFWRILTSFDVAPSTGLFYGPLKNVEKTARFPGEGKKRRILSRLWLSCFLFGPTCTIRTFLSGGQVKIKKFLAWPCGMQNLVVTRVVMRIKPPT